MSTHDQIHVGGGKMTSPTEALGRVISVRGSQASVGLFDKPIAKSDEVRATVGRFIALDTGKSRLVGVITDVSLHPAPANGAYEHRCSAHVDLVGEIKDTGTPGARFQRGVTEYPDIDDPVTMVTGDELRLIFNITGAGTIKIGELQQDPVIDACVDVDDMLSKHFAVLGTTGVGKSSGLAMILQGIMQARPDVRLFVLDVHNEYGRSFGDKAQVINPRNLRLPFWLFNFEEIVDVFFGGRPGSEDEIDILAEVIPYAKSNYGLRGTGDRALLRRADPKSTGYTVDTPVPYRLGDLLAILDERMGKLENRASRMLYHRLIARVETVSSDTRYAFMFENANVGGDTMAEVFAHLYRLPPAGVPMTVMQLAGFPSEVVDAVVSVICRMAFDFGLWSDGAAPLLFVCEEAHRYVSADRTIGFSPTRRSISRIAKEGRKYGVFLGLVSQRPAELDPTILSQCSTLFVMRMTNDRDQAILRSAVSDTAANLLAFLPSLGTREALAFGEGVALPTRLKFSNLPPELLPRSEAVQGIRDDGLAEINQAFVATVLERWRGATTSQRGIPDDGPDQTPEVEAPLQPAQSNDGGRSKLLKKPLAEAAAPLGGLQARFGSRRDDAPGR
jgi:DNA helicase HerA-like ATPase